MVIGFLVIGFLVIGHWSFVSLAGCPLIFPVIFKEQ